MEKNFSFKQERRQFFRAYVEMIRPFLKIRGREADVFAELLYYNYVKRNIKDSKDRAKIILGSESRKDIVEHLDITTAIFRNALTGLRKKSLVKEDGTIADVYLVMGEENTFDLKFTFVLEN